MGTEETRGRTGLDPLYDDENMADGVATPPADGLGDGAATPPADGLGDLEIPTVEFEVKEEVKEEPDDDEGTEQSHREERPPRPRPRR